MKCFIVRNKTKGTILFLKTNTKKKNLKQTQDLLFHMYLIKPNKRRKAMENMKRKQVYDFVRAKLQEKYEKINKTRPNSFSVLRHLHCTKNLTSVKHKSRSPPDSLAKNHRRSLLSSIQHFLFCLSKHKLQRKSL